MNLKQICDPPPHRLTSAGCTIGLDVGTTSVKVLLVDDAGSVRFRTNRQLAMDIGEDASAIQDPLAIAEAVTQVMIEVLNFAACNDLELCCVGVSAAMHSLVAVSDDGTPLTAALTWMDGRAARQAEELWSDTLVRQIYRENGTPIHAMSPFVKLAWIRQTDPELWERQPRFVSIKEFIWHRWFGVWEIDESMASATGLFHLAHRQWNQVALDTVGVRTEQLSEIVSTYHTRTDLKDRSLLDAGWAQKTRFTIGASDGVLANIALGVTDPSAMVLTVGTSLAVRTGFKSIVTNERFRPFCYRFDSDCLIVGAPSNSGGIVLDWLIKTVSDGDSTETLAALCREAQDVRVDGLFCLPYLAGERAPLWNASARAAFIGLQLQHRPVHLIRAAVEGILFNAYWLMSELMTETGEPKRIFLSGKLFDEEWIQTFCADLFAIPVQAGQVAEDASTLGAVVIANAAVGVATTWHGRPNHEAELRLPDSTRSGELRKHYSEYRRLCGMLHCSDM